jgi:hypothetical protein
MTVNAVTIIVKGIFDRLRWTSEMPEVRRRRRHLGHSLLGAPMCQTAIVMLLADPLYRLEFLRGVQTSLPRLHQRLNQGVAMKGPAMEALLRLLEEPSH